MEKFKNRPFALLGINTDGERAEALEAVQKNQLNWRSWYDGSNGPITSLYQVRGFPSFFILDGKGIIRAVPSFSRNVAQEMEQAVEALLREIEEGKS